MAWLGTYEEVANAMIVKRREAKCMVDWLWGVSLLVTFEMS